MNQIYQFLTSSNNFWVWAIAFLICYCIIALVVGIVPWLIDRYDEYKRPYMHRKFTPSMCFDVYITIGFLWLPLVILFLWYGITDCFKSVFSKGKKNV